MKCGTELKIIQIKDDGRSTEKIALYKRAKQKKEHTERPTKKNSRIETKRAKWNIMKSKFYKADLARSMYLRN